MKKIAFFLSAFALVALVACGGGEETAEATVDTAAVATVDTAAAAADTAVDAAATDAEAAAE